MAKVSNPRFGGMQFFGPVASFAISKNLVTPADVDAFLGDPVGTAITVPQQVYGITGTLTGTTPSAVLQQISLITSFAGTSGRFGYPTRLPFPDDFLWAPRMCYFQASEFRPGTTTAAGVGYAAPYKLVIRNIS